MDPVARPDGQVVTLLAGRYEVGPLVGVGGTARVYRAWDREQGRPVAVKVFLSGSAPALGQGASREPEVLAGVRHPALVAVHGSGLDPWGCPFVVMDLVEGRSLDDRLRDGPVLAVAAAARLGAVLADALAVVHARGVVHRDVKPANVLLDADEQPRLTDFGIARVVDATRVTATGFVIGTAAYMAPEQVRGETVGPPADVYALGLVLLETLTGRREYGGGAVESALARLHREPQVPADLPGPLATTLRTMTALDPAERPTATQVAAALRDRPDRAPLRPRRSGRRVAPAAALGSLLVAAAAGATTLLGAAMPTGAEPAPAGPAAAPAPAPRMQLTMPDLTNAVDAAAAARPVPAAAPAPPPRPPAAPDGRKKKADAADRDDHEKGDRDGGDRDGGDRGRGDRDRGDRGDARDDDGGKHGKADHDKDDKDDDDKSDRSGSNSGKG